MNKAISVTFSESASPLHPFLQKALSSLDFQLETELARYRRQKAENPTKAAIPIKQPQILRILSPDLTSQDLQSPINLETHNSPRLEPELQVTTSPSEALSSIVHQPEASTETENIISPATSQTPPEDYLESSERLLRNLAEKEGKQKEQENFLSGLLTPLGLGSMLLLLVASALLGSALISPESFSNLGLDKLLSWLNISNQKATTNPETASTSVISASEAIPQEPNLASEEFVNLDLASLSTLEPNANANATTTAKKPSTATNPATTVAPPINSVIPPNTVVMPGMNNDLASALLPPSLRPQSLPPYSLPPAVAPIPVPPNTQTAINSSYYYVLVEYSGDRSLEQVKQKVKEAFVRDFPQGKRIQVASFPNQEDAKAFREKLTKQGIKAEIYKP